MVASDRRSELESAASPPSDDSKERSGYYEASVRFLLTDLQIALNLMKVAVALEDQSSADLIHGNAQRTWRRACDVLDSIGLNNVERRPLEERVDELRHDLAEYQRRDVATRARRPDR